MIKQNTISQTTDVSPSDGDDPVISVRKVSKMYPLYADPRDRLKQSLWHGLPKFLRGKPREFYREFWALRNISFEVKPGEALGIIGRNGSGKSTLLQIIAGTLTPTTGEVQVHGRVAALLELGSGFNPEFTGRENVYLNGAILGFSNSEMDDLFDEIAAFADIGEFIDQPVKLYSSGMTIRLAFAVQACVEPDVLIVDEALAVGDIFFQQKCHTRMEKLRKQGTTIILVTHNMGDVRKYCEQTILLDKGETILMGSSAEATKKYFSLQQSPNSASKPIPLPSPEPNEVSSKWSTTPVYPNLSFWPTEEAFIDFSAATSIGEGWARCTAIALCDAGGEPCRVFQQGHRAYFYYEFEALQDLHTPSGAIAITNNKNIIVHGKGSHNYLLNSFPSVKKGKRIRLRQSVVLNLSPGEYTFDVTIMMITADDYANLEFMSASEILSRIFTLNRIDQAGVFSIIRPVNQGMPLKHSGICDLPGDCEIALS
jgi:lipopolysaccharide transport system ATP-binding protein